jgi:hypothetical protein
MGIRVLSCATRARTSDDWAGVSVTTPASSLAWTITAASSAHLSPWKSNGPNIREVADTLILSHCPSYMFAPHRSIQSCPAIGGILAISHCFRRPRRGRRDVTVASTERPAPQYVSILSAMPGDRRKITERQHNILATHGSSRPCRMKTTVKRAHPFIAASRAIQLGRERRRNFCCLD